MDGLELRSALEQITKGEADIAKHPALVAALPSHSIQHVPASDARSPRFPEYNCFAFAFNLAESERFRAIASRFSGIHADETFTRYLLDRGVLSELAAQPADGIILYFQGEAPTHAGKLLGDRVLSKWGVGQLWDHKVWEVPTQYGETVKCYQSIASRASEAAFIDFASLRGVRYPERLPGWPVA